MNWIELNPFDEWPLCVASSSSNLYFIKDFKTETVPSQIHQYSISSSSKGFSVIKTTANNSTSANNLNQVTFSPHVRNMIYFVLSREILIFDLNLEQVRCFFALSEFF